MHFRKKKKKKMNGKRHIIKQNPLNTDKDRWIAVVSVDFFFFWFRSVYLFTALCAGREPRGVSVDKMTTNRFIVNYAN